MLKALESKDLINTANAFRGMISDAERFLNMDKEICEIYALIIKFIPDFTKVLPDEHVYCAFAPSGIRPQVQDLFAKIKKQNQIG